MTSEQGAPEQAEIDRVIFAALAEDIGDGDVTTDNTIPEDSRLTGSFLAKETGVLAGVEVARRTFALLDPRVRFHVVLGDGERVERGQVLAEVTGPGRAILTGERVALNFLQRMSGIATAARRYMDAVAGTHAVILDTRKTAPGLRLFDKWAVRLGGAANHRTGLYDMALIKDNHIAAVGSLAEAVHRVRAGDPRGRPIEVEVTNLVQLAEALQLPIDRILLDNMTPAMMAQAVRIAGGRIPLEASGGVNLKTVRTIAETGVDFISVGALTHSVNAARHQFGSKRLKIERGGMSTLQPIDRTGMSAEDIYEGLKARIGEYTPDFELRVKAELAYEINQLKIERNAVILGHNYMEPALFHSVPDFRGRLAGSLAQGRDDRQGRDRLLRRALYGRDRQDPQPDQDGADPVVGGGLFSGRQHHGGRCAQPEGALSGRAGGDLCEHLCRRQGRERRLLHLGQRGCSREGPGRRHVHLSPGRVPGAECGARIRQAHHHPPQAAERRARSRHDRTIRHGRVGGPVRSAREVQRTRHRGRARPVPRRGDPVAP